MSEAKMTKEEFLANRKAAGHMIDVKTCAIAEWYADLADPYGVHRPPADCIGRLTFVASAESNGWVGLGDLPEDKRRALYARIERENWATDDDIPF